MMRSLVRLALAGAAGFVLSLNAHAAPVTYEIGGTFVGRGDPNLVAAFEGSPFVLRFTYDAALADYSIINVYDATYWGQFSNFEFLSTVNGLPYDFKMPYIDPVTNFIIGQLTKLNNDPITSSYPRDMVQAAAINYEYLYPPQNLPLEILPLEINGYFPFVMALEFGSVLDENGNNGLDFVTNLNLDFDPIALVNSGAFGLVGDFVEAPGATYKGVWLGFVSHELLAGDPIIDEYGWTAIRQIITDFSYIRIIDGPVAAVDEPAPLLISLMGFAATALYGWRRRTRH